MVFSWISTHEFHQKGFNQEIACLYNRGCLLSIEIIPAFIDTTRTDIIICEALATATDYI